MCNNDGDAAAVGDSGLDTVDIKACLKRFAQAYFPDQEAKLVVAAQPRFATPLLFNHGTHEVEITVTSAESGEVLATGTCAVKDSDSSRGYVTILEAETE